jgi:hypothetical protein
MMVLRGWSNACVTARATRQAAAIPDFMNPGICADLEQALQISTLVQGFAMGAVAMALLWLWSTVWMPWAASLKRARLEPRATVPVPRTGRAATAPDTPIVSRILASKPFHSLAELAGMEGGGRSHYLFGHDMERLRRGAQALPEAESR